MPASSKQKVEAKVWSDGSYVFYPTPVCAIPVLAFSRNTDPLSNHIWSGKEQREGSEISEYVASVIRAGTPEVYLK
uniref:Ribosomal protein L31 n=1 Tax=Phaeophyceae sp. TaxID=2249243 RepID=A0A8E8PDP7_9PHAE|nr:ribosomal protein L31 [Phaeophyceae sp.]